MRFVPKPKVAAGMMAAVLLAGAAAASVAEAAELKAPVYSWQEPHATVLTSGNLEWAPKPFIFERSMLAA
jgi:hypothetical protein